MNARDVLEEAVYFWWYAENPDPDDLPEHLLAALSEAGIVLCRREDDSPGYLARLVPLDVGR